MIIDPLALHAIASMLCKPGSVSYSREIPSLSAISEVFHFLIPAHNKYRATLWWQCIDSFAYVFLELAGKYARLLFIATWFQHRSFIVARSYPPYVRDG